MNRVTPHITWAKPAAITYGTALSSRQLNATANVPGSFTYTPPSGTVLNAGTQTLSVGFVPTDSTDYTTASSSVTITVNKASTTTSISESPSTSLLGQLVTFTATVSSPNGITPSGTVTFKQGTTVLGTAPLGGSGQATFTKSTLSVGSYAITARYDAAANFAASTSATVRETVNKLPTSTSVTSSSNPATFGKSVTFTATVALASGTSTSFAGSPTGSVSFYDGTKKLGTRTLSGAGVATFSLMTLARGSHSITVVMRATVILLPAHQPLLCKRSADLGRVVNTVRTTTRDARLKQGIPVLQTVKEVSRGDDGINLCEDERSRSVLTRQAS